MSNLRKRDRKITARFAMKEKEEEKGVGHFFLENQKNEITYSPIGTIPFREFTRQLIPTTRYSVLFTFIVTFIICFTREYKTGVFVTFVFKTEEGPELQRYYVIYPMSNFTLQASCSRLPDSEPQVSNIQQESLISSTF